MFGSRDLTESLVVLEDDEKLDLLCMLKGLGFVFWMSFGDVSFEGSG